MNAHGRMGSLFLFLLLCSNSYLYVIAHGRMGSLFLFLTWDDGGPNDCQVVTCGTNLKFFSYSGELKTDVCLYSSSLVNGRMDLRSVTVSEWDGKQREAVYHVHKLHKGFSSVESLTGSPVPLEDTPLPEKYEKKKKLQIGSSTSLFIDTAKTIKIWRFAATEKELYLIKVLLDVSSVLEKMYIWGGLSKQQEILMLPRGSTNCEIIFLRTLHKLIWA